MTCSLSARWLLGYLLSGTCLVQALAQFSLPGQSDELRAALRLVNQGRINFEAEEYKQAIACYDEAIKLRPDHLPAYRGRIAVNQKLEAYAQVISDSDHVISSKEAQVDDYRVRGTAHASLRHFPEARADIDWALILSPGNEECLLMRSLIALNQGDYASALRDADRVLGKKPADAMASLYRGIARFGQDNYYGALNDLDVAVAAEPTWADAFEFRAKAKIELGLLVASLRDLDIWISLQADAPTAYRLRGLVLADLEESEASLSAFAQALKLSPGDGIIYVARAYALHSSGRYAEAIADCDRALALDVDSKEWAYFYRALASVALGRKDAARADFDRAIRHRPDFDMAIEARGVLRQGNGDLPGALADYEETIRLGGSQADQAQLYRTILLKRLHRDDAGQQLAKALVNFTERWTRIIAQYLVGEITETEFIAAATLGGRQERGSQLCEAYYYAGMMQLFQGHEERARELLEKSVATKRVRDVIYNLARAEFEHLSAPAGEP